MYPEPLAGIPARGILSINAIYRQPSALRAIANSPAFIDLLRLPP